MAIPVPKGADREAEQAPLGLDWSQVLELLVREHGGWAALADQLLHRDAAARERFADRQTVERGLRRLAARGHRSGGQYGRWVLRVFGMPSPVDAWARWLGQYHSRFHDLPTALRHDQIRLWDRPPISESPLAAWVHLAMAGVLYRLRDRAGALRRLELARGGAERAGPAAVAELELFSARLAFDEDMDQEACARLDAAERAMKAEAILPEDRACYHARLCDQRAYRLLHVAAAVPDFRAALRIYEQIPAEAPLPFVQFRRAIGRAYCLWRLGERGPAEALARAACDHAGDGGFVRLRIMALDLLAHILEEPEARALAARAALLARQLEDEELLSRLGRA